jgi:hypothetical protein
MKKIVTITIEVDMKCKEAKEWHKPSDFFNSSVNETLDRIKDESIKKRCGKYYEEYFGKSIYKVNVKTIN